MVCFGRLTAVMPCWPPPREARRTPSLAQAKIRIAVANFENNSTWAWWGDNLGDGGGRRACVAAGADRQDAPSSSDAQLARDTAGAGSGASGAVTAATAAKVGKLLGVQRFADRLDHRVLDQAARRSGCAASSAAMRTPRASSTPAS